METLSLPTQARLRSTQILTSLPQIISELLQNSLDAGARLVEIGLDAQEWTCWVKDDGTGIGKEGLGAIAQEGDAGRYSTSKTYAQNTMNAESTFGFRGEALASAAELSCLEIVSRTALSRGCWSVIAKGGKRLYEGSAVRWRREHAGTVVCVRDAFYNLPVRRLSHPSPSRTWELVRQEVETYALVFPGVSFSLEDTHSGNDPSSKNKIIRIPRTSSILNSFGRMYGQALIEQTQSIDASSQAVRIHGFISLCGSYSKSFQFLYINRHPIRSSNLHRVIDSCFSRSSFSRTALVREEGDGVVASRRSPRKSEKRPVYVLNITLPSHEVDNCFEPDKSAVQFQNRTHVIRLVSSTIRGFLFQNNFSLNEDASKGHEDSIGVPPDSPRKRRKVDDTFHDSGFVEAETLRALSFPKPQNLEDSQKGTPPDLFAAVDEGPRDISWTDASTGENFIIDSRTGNARRSVEETDNGTNQMGFYRSERRTLKLQSQRTIQSPGVTPEWLSCALKSIQVYTPPHDSFVKPSFPSRSDGSRFSQPTGNSQNEGAPMRLSRDDLLQATVINQVDRKFVACLVHQGSDEKQQPSTTVPSGSSATPVLILVDQHAADERIRVETFLKPLCLGFLHSTTSGGQDEPGRVQRITQLVPPVPVLLTRHEGSLLQRNAHIQKAFQRWGISLSEFPKALSEETFDSGGNNEYIQVFVDSLPSVLCDKLLQGNELQECIKSFLGQIQQGELDIVERNSHTDGKSEKGEEWLAALRHCPRSLLELVNSKACRGAIMFNDPLTKEQCERLILQLSKTSYPFQCAHGRPSLIPMVSVNNKPEVWDRKGRLRCDWKKFSR